MHSSHKRLHRRNLQDDVGDNLMPNSENGSAGLKRDEDQNQDGGGGDGEGHKKQSTVIQNVYVTASKTFEGDVAGYKTIVKENSDASTKTAKHHETLHTAHKDVPTAISKPGKTDSLDTVLAQATGHASTSEPTSLLMTHAAPTTSAVESTATSTVAASKDGESSGTSAGTKAGIAFGVLGGLLVIGLLVFFLFTRRKKQADGQRLADDEKFGAANNQTLSPVPPPVSTMNSNTRAPRVSLRPVTQFFENWNMDKRSSNEAAVALTPTSALERPSTSQSNHPANPFGNQAELAPRQDQWGHSQAVSPISPADSAVSSQDPFNATSPTVAVAGLARQTSVGKDGRVHQDVSAPEGQLSTIPGSPAPSSFSDQAVSPRGATSVPPNGSGISGSSAPTAAANVHRVQLDFKPTLQDEMELAAGDLVRLLHEYDDGWALCARMDQSTQGVVPRTCLSTRPVKPRGPNGGPRPGPPVNPNAPAAGRPPVGHPRHAPHPSGQRSMTPQGMYGPGRPQSPAGRPIGPPGSRPHSPAHRPMNAQGRPMSPGPRAQSPGPRYQGPLTDGRSRSGSVASQTRMGPSSNGPGPSRMNPDQLSRPGPPSKKLLPGQAI